MKDVAKKINLLDARKEALEQAKYGSIRPHGKLWGMDVFSWVNPEMEVLISTFHSFPFPVVFICDTTLMEACVENDSTFLMNCHQLYTVQTGDSRQLTLDARYENKWSEMESLSAVFSAIERNKLAKGVVLFCAEGVDAEVNHSDFLQLLSTHQND